MYQGPVLALGYGSGQGRLIPPALPSRDPQPIRCGAGAGTDTDTDGGDTPCLEFGQASPQLSQGLEVAPWRK